MSVQNKTDSEFTVVAVKAAKKVADVVEAIKSKPARKKQKVNDYVIQSPLLAAKIKNDDDLERLTFPVLATPKLDGIRALRVNADLLSRSLKPIQNSRIRKVLTELLPEGSDGEVMVDGEFQDVTSAVMKKIGSDAFEKTFTFYWFDYVVNAAAVEKPYAQRMADMKTYVESHPEILQHPQAKIVPLYPETAASVEELLAYEKKFLEAGFEGAMVRSINGRYKFGYSTFNEGILIKLKRFEDAEARVIGVQELLHNGNEAVTSELGLTKRSSKKEGKTESGMLGALLVESLDGKMKFKVGTGLTEKMRTDLWKEKESLIGKFVKYKYFVMGSKDAPRFPTFLGFRHPDDM